ncbi:nucleotide-diphospho-sugar transferase [Hanseniaspora valbyensis NRRL Y-1626]|uniref:Nucleotide-diphospho-sugar transferase n=1 Tax=Hanseniaspora valbyensis NRRL Y-1626 TaxID=766949 RepID=A0A1B7THU1_9ASCO|nr:nucleotide-diphospho-sugar transferase [Hanseniaspora valbyensis NRRL Y-1626]
MLVPVKRVFGRFSRSFRRNYTTVLSIIFSCLILVLLAQIYKIDHKKFENWTDGNSLSAIFSPDTSVVENSDNNNNNIINNNHNIPFDIPEKDESPLEFEPTQEVEVENVEEVEIIEELEKVEEVETIEELEKVEEVETIEEVEIPVEFDLDKTFDFVVDFINQHNPNVTEPTSSTFSEKDISKTYHASQLGNYLTRADDVPCTNKKNDWNKLSYKYMMENYLIVNEKMTDIIKEKHVQMIENVNNNFEFDTDNFYQGTGVVFVGGGKHSAMVYSIIKIMRLLGTTLPVEVFIPDRKSVESDTNFCEMLQKEDNGRCIYLDEKFDAKKTLNQTSFKTYQYKSLALLTSSFQHVLLLDADDYPLVKLDDAFEHEAYKNTGMVVWPDMWRRSTHPFFYESANITINFEKRKRNFIDTFSDQKDLIPENVDSLTDVPYHDFEGTLPDPSSETGQFMIDKKKHWKSLILSFYYNTFGPNLYYHLLSQYSAGQGDKETFIAAAHVLNLPYYQVFSASTLDGYFRQNGEGFKSTGYYQKDFRNDFAIKKKLDTTNNLLLKENLNTFPLPIRELYFSSKATETFAMFAHINFPKFNPLELAYHNEFTYEDKPFRGLTHKECLTLIDLEKEVINIYNDVFCLNEAKPFEQLVTEERLIDHEKLCNYYKKRVEFIKLNKLL